MIEIFRPMARPRVNPHPKRSKISASDRHATKKTTIAISLNISTSKACVCTSAKMRDPSPGGEPVGFLTGGHDTSSGATSAILRGEPLAVHFRGAPADDPNGQRTAFKTERAAAVWPVGIPGDVVISAGWAVASVFFSHGQHRHCRQGGVAESNRSASSRKRCQRPISTSMFKLSSISHDR